MIELICSMLPWLLAIALTGGGCGWLWLALRPRRPAAWRVVENKRIIARTP